MPDLDVVDLLSDPDFASDITVLRSVRTQGQNGVVTDATGSYLTYGVNVPMPASQVAMMPDGMRLSGAISIVTPFRLVALTDTTAPDQIVWHNKKYRVRSVEDWTDWGQGFVIAVCELIDYTQDTSP